MPYRVLSPPAPASDDDPDGPDVSAEDLVVSRDAWPPVPLDLTDRPTDREVVLTILAGVTVLLGSAAVLLLP